MPERRFDDGYWDDPFVQSAPKDAKLLYAYLWTNKHCNPAGLYQITPKTISFETGISEIVGVFCDPIIVFPGGWGEIGRASCRERV